MTIDAAPKINLERPFRIAGGATFGSGHREDLRAQQGAAIDSFQAPASINVDEVENLFGFARAGKLADVFTNSIYLWITVVIALVFGSIGVVLGFENNDRSTILKDRSTSLTEEISRFNSVTSKLTSISERVDAIATELSQSKLVEQEKDDSFTRSESLLEDNLERLSDRLDRSLGEIRGKDAASELRLDRLEADQAIVRRPSTTASPNGETVSKGYDKSDPSKAENSLPPTDSSALSWPGSEIVSAAALAQMEGLPPASVRDGSILASKVSKPLKHNSHHHHVQTPQL
jgi:hypothetical protein